MKTGTVVLLLVLALVVGAVAGWFFPKGQNVGGVTVGNEYNATTTPFTEGWTTRVLDTGNGTLGSIVVTKAGSVEFALRDNANTTAYEGATSTRTLVYIPANLAAGTYVFDVNYSRGLVLDVIQGTLGTSTILFR